MSGPLAPKQALYGRAGKVWIPACVHYAGAEKLVEKALQLQLEHQGRFDVTIDLEDGAAAGQEAEGARRAAEFLARPRPAGHRVGVRVHDPHHPAFLQDLALLSPAADHLAYWVVPKVDSAQGVRATRDAIAQATQSLAPKAPLHVLIETHGALRDVFEIAAIAEVETLDFGLMDFVSEHQGAIPAECMRSPGQFEHALLRRAKGTVAAAAHAFSKVPVHNVTLDLRDPEQTEADARRARREFGFLRMWSVHPLQIEAILRGMAPSDEEIALAAELLVAAQARDFGPLERDGRLYDRASYRYYWAILCQAERAGLPLPAAAQAFFRPLPG